MPGPRRKSLEATGSKRFVLPMYRGCSTARAPGTPRRLPVREVLKKRRLPIVGGNPRHDLFLHVEDAASAAVTAGEAGIYSVTDDEPARDQGLDPHFRRVGRGQTATQGSVLAGRADRPANRSRYRPPKARAASNAKFEAQTGWEPSIPSWRQGFFEAT